MISLLNSTLEYRTQAIALEIFHSPIGSFAFFYFFELMDHKHVINRMTRVR